jgi:L-methionine (R)-S-oxide reductase
MSRTEVQLQKLRAILDLPLQRRNRAERIAEAIRAEGGYRWVGLYDVDHVQKLVIVVGWSGPQAPAHPVFPTSQGITSRAIALRQTINVGDVTLDRHYLTALDGTRSELIVPVIEQGRVIGTIDVESEHADAFGPTAQLFLEWCAQALQDFWTRELATP